MDWFQKIWLYIKVNWVKILIITVVLATIIFSAIFLNYCVKNYFGLEPYMRKNISGQMALLLPMFVIVHLISLPIMMGMQYYFMQGGNLGKNNIQTAKTNVKWDEVIGMESAKKEAWELVKLLKDRAMVKKVGGKIIKGTMMMGPPGCGKTYLAKAIANECGLPLLAAVGSEFVGMFVGVGTARMKALFKQARAMAQIHGGCIIFIDEIDSFARPRGADTGGGARLDQNSTINQFLTEMDGLRNTENNIVVIAATNCREDELDSAIMRAGRFDRKVHVTRPNLKEREELFNFYLKKVSFEENVSANIMARKTVWFTPAEIDGCVREASLIALRDGRDTLGMKDLSEAYERVAFGQKSNIVLTDDEKLSTAYHETGHAIIYYLIDPTNEVLKASVIPRKGMLGYVFARPVEELHSQDRDSLLAQIKVSIASYVVENKKFSKTTSGVGGGRGSDFHTALGIAYNMVSRFGMGKSGLIGDFSAICTPSEKTLEKLDEDAQDILQSCLRSVSDIIDNHWEAVEYFAQELYQKEELDYDEIQAIFDKFGLQKGSLAPNYQPKA